MRADALGHPIEVWRVEAGRRRPLGRVEQVDEVWRLAEEWWRAPDLGAGAAGGNWDNDAARGLARTYFRVILEGGRLLTLFHDDAHPPRAPGARGETCDRRERGELCRHWYEQPYGREEAP